MYFALNMSVSPLVRYTYASDVNVPNVVIGSPFFESSMSFAYSDAVMSSKLSFLIDSIPSSNGVFAIATSVSLTLRYCTMVHHVRSSSIYFL